MDIKLYNTKVAAKQLFEPLDKDQVGMYVCGPTVYDRAHIGNARAAVVFDVLFRILQEAYGQSKVRYVRNITDVDDKINAAAKQRNISIGELTATTTQMFHDDMFALGCMSPTDEPRATDHIGGMIAMCERLISTNNAYAAEGHVLFSVDSFPDYGKLSKRTKDEMIAGARVEVAPYKKSPGDFVLWKPSADDEPGWDSPWGRGRPGWHIECSVMSTTHLGEDFDIHGGGADLKFPHHENEIAQSRCANPGSIYANFWVHNGFLSVEGEKMSKSLGNFITVHDLLEQGEVGEVIRYALLATHYRKPLDWTKKALSDAKKALSSFYQAIEGVDIDAQVKASSVVAEAIADDLNTPKALAQLHSMANKTSKASGEEKVKLASELLQSAKLIGLMNLDIDEWNNLVHKKNTVNSELEVEIQTLVDNRKQARLDKDWATSDSIRDELEAKGVVIKDNPDGTTDWTLSS